MKNILHRLFTPHRMTVYAIMGVLLLIRFLVITFIEPGLSLGKHLLFIGASYIYLIYIWEIIRFLNFRLDRYFHWENGIALRLAIQIAISFILIVPVSQAMVYLAKFMLPEDPTALVMIPPTIDRFITVVSFMVIFIIIVAINLGYFGLYFFRQWKRSLIESERLAKEKALVQKERAMLQYTNLQNQLNPHFFFNSITSLSSLIHEDKQLASDFLQQLSKVYRYILQNKEKEKVELKAEVEFVQNYISLLKTRFPESFDIHIDIDESAMQRDIVPVTLQVMIENATKHNRMTEEEPLKLEIFSNDKYLIVRNNFQPKKQMENSNKVGLENMKQLYAYLTEVPMEIEFSKDEFIVKIPLL